MVSAYNGGYGYVMFETPSKDLVFMKFDPKFLHSTLKFSKFDDK